MTTDFKAANILYNIEVMTNASIAEANDRLNARIARLRINTDMQMLQLRTLTPTINRFRAHQYSNMYWLSVAKVFLRVSR